MRNAILALSTLGLLATPALAYRSGGLAEAERLIRVHHLLTPEQRACARLERGTRAIREVTEVRVLRRVDARCPGDAQTPKVWFDLFIDNVSGSYQWTPEDPVDLETVPGVIAPRRQRG